MKTLITPLILFGCAHWIAAADIPPWQVIKASERGARMIKIVEAASEYEVKFGKFPPTLFALTSKGFLNEEDLCLRNSDKSVTVPDYYPEPTDKVLSESVVIKAPSDDRSYQIVVMKDLSICGMENRDLLFDTLSRQIATLHDEKIKLIPKDILHKLTECPSPHDLVNLDLESQYWLSQVSGYK